MTRLKARSGKPAVQVDVLRTKDSPLSQGRAENNVFVSLDHA